MTKGEAGVKCCVQLRDRLREKVEESGEVQGKYRLSEPWVDRGSDQEKQCTVQVGMLSDKRVWRLVKGRGV